MRGKRRESVSFEAESVLGSKSPMVSGEHLHNTINICSKEQQADLDP